MKKILTRVKKGFLVVWDKLKINKMLSSFKEGISIYWFNLYELTLPSVLIGILVGVMLKEYENPPGVDGYLNILQGYILEQLGFDNIFATILNWSIQVLFLVMIFLIIGYVVVLTTQKHLKEPFSVKVTMLFMKVNVGKIAKVLFTFALVFVLGFLFMFLTADSLLKIEDNGETLATALYMTGFGLIFLTMFIVSVLMYLRFDHQDLFVKSFIVALKSFFAILLWTALLIFISYFVVNRIAINVLQDFAKKDLTVERLSYIKLVINMIYFYILGNVVVYFFVTQVLFVIKLKDKHFKNEEWNFIDINYQLEK